MQKRLRFLIAAAIIVFVCTPACRKLIANTFICSVLASLTLTYMISLFFSRQQNLPRRLGASFLIFGSLTYLVSGALGFVSHVDILEGFVWEFLISPYLPLSVAREQALQPGWDPSQLPYVVFPDGRHVIYSAIVLFSAIIAIIGVYFLVLGSKVGVSIWVVVLGILTISFAGYLYVRREGVYVQLCWEVLYLAAFSLVQFVKQEENSSVLALSDEW